MPDRAGSAGEVLQGGARLETVAGVSALYAADGAVGAARLKEPLGDGWEQVSLVVDVVTGALAGEYQAVAGRDCYGGPTGDVFGLIVTPEGHWVSRIVTETGQFSALAPASPGRHLLAMTYDGAWLRLSVDGADVGATAATGPLRREPDTPFVLGAYAGGEGRFAGGIVEARLYDHALSKAEVVGLREEWLGAVAMSAAVGFVFAQAADIHITDTRSVEILNDAVDRVNGEPQVAFSLWLGDLTQSSARDEMVLARLGLSRLTKPHYVLRGNHDVAGTHFQDEFGPLHQVFTYGGWTFLLADSNPGDAVPMAPTEIAWIREQLTAIAAEPPLVFCTHHPLMPHTKHYLLAGADEVLALFKGHNLKAVLSGHYHGNQEETVDGVLFTTTACCSSTRGNFDGTTAKGVRLFRCQDGRISTEFRRVRDE